MQAHFRTSGAVAVKDILAKSAACDEDEREDTLLSDSGPRTGAKHSP